MDKELMIYSMQIGRAHELINEADDKVVEYFENIIKWIEDNGIPENAENESLNDIRMLLSKAQVLLLP